ncbi:MAG: hypothetical protein V3V08_07565 [Nannocystaceae bacterium]
MKRTKSPQDAVRTIRGAPIVLGLLFAAFALPVAVHFILGTPTRVVRGEQVAPKRNGAAETDASKKNP